ncbi:MAG TPA: selenocysteine-specific translation elongation factor [Anaerolineaceae bacterium]|nr:selenocysteine-specific translation elongation factor [Anaerolineaceae bacterium]
MRVIGTAGHVDHGKSTLVAALTGTHPDRLKEEQARQMTIELGFAWFTLPNGEEVGIVDVPGHRDFIENMLAGAGGIDAAMFVIAADEGIMPQTREHLAILDLLQVQSGVVALTKIDLVDDPDWLEMVELDIHQVLQGTTLENAGIIRVSARSGAGLSELKQALEVCLAEHPARPNLGRPRLPIDRVFTIAGFGTVVTGTLADGQFKLGEDVEILPEGIHGRIRSLQNHKRKEESAIQGSRTAVNIVGVEVDQIKRGDVVVHPGDYQSTRLIDAHFHLLKDASSALQHSADVKLFLGAAEISARVRLLGYDELSPDQSGWIQLDLRQPVVAVRGDRYVLRRPSPGETLGGGMIVDPHPKKRHKRFSNQVIAELEMLRRGSPSEVLLQAAIVNGFSTLNQISDKAGLQPEKALAGLQELVERGQLLLLEKGQISPKNDLYAVSAMQWKIETEKLLTEIGHFHQNYPLRKGMPREELKSRLKMATRLFNASLGKWKEEGLLSEIGAFISRSNYQVRFASQQQSIISDLWKKFETAPFSPPSVKECLAAIGEEIYNALIDKAELVQISSEVVYRRKDYDYLVNSLQENFGNQPEFTVAQFRDKYQTSRKYALAFLEHLDKIGITIRDGDIRRLKKSA